MPHKQKGPEGSRTKNPVVVSRRITMTDRIAASGKKKFEPPTLTMYGDLRSLTFAVGEMGESDGKGMFKTRA